ncbi:hypothetical protein phi18_215 [Bacillus phage phi18]|uniref:Uncharacterized protein n=1 Tax=Bacillus phage vB_BsuM-Goe2 TaxID=1933062 RepID=A0A1Z1DEA3_9CAUD|nr:hypothetical protein Goe2_c01600 [Bacillus phage vB_BsuM-Goe2]APZ82454.1 hypothetical protein Goe2_c21800 [Bacillus phage vB_BsuM-Goe2]UAV84288.1 hypothetical protein phi18_018 [Bacillus phage phi18]UAV84485.1 hypothetical protein phi18_215 [Bacillus phage phi18]
MDWTKMTFMGTVDEVKEIWNGLEEAGRLYAVWLSDDHVYGIVDVNEEGLFCLGWVSDISPESLQNMLGGGAELFESYEDVLSEHGGSIAMRVEV